MGTSRLGELGKYHDLAGFDPRATGFGTQIDCQAFGGPQPRAGASEKDTALERIRRRALAAATVPEP
ncbi:hypothetical protein D5S19_14550 [Amycolatopsis panacis]|uniref:Uncharacterized protein n=1 Tax=Amycolatopsis panacis TaxID=2340917 RepID=A0A419I4B2_9PSEU|nr:hypothetical protein D5S19_14550 [Amycolatopsis panacis]